MSERMSDWNGRSPSCILTGMKKLSSLAHCNTIVRTVRILSRTFGVKGVDFLTGVTRIFRLVSILACKFNTYFFTMNKQVAMSPKNNFCIDMSQFA